MTLDPEHFDGISELAQCVKYGIDIEEHRLTAESVWHESLDPLYDGDNRRILLEPLDSVSRHRINIEDAALSEQPFETEHAVDAGTINPTQFKNGLVVDVAQAAMASTPTNLDLHRSRTVVATFHSNNNELDVYEEWAPFDDGYSRRRAVKIPPLSSIAADVVHALALYYAESEHARTYSENVSDLLILDGPVYPRGMLRWANQNNDVSDFMIEDPCPTTVLENYIRLVEDLKERNIPLVGFVKNPQRQIITQTVRSSDDIKVVPWADDTAFFTHVLEVGEHIDDVVIDGVQRKRWERDDTALTYTNWFRSHAGIDQTISSGGKMLGIEKNLPLEDYEVTFFVVYDPRKDLVFRVEAPYAFTKDEDLREQLTLQLLQDIAIADGPPLIVEKADELARISRPEKQSLIDSFEQQFQTDEDQLYDSHRWDNVT
ncbi:DNA double-strand break repair nuclease NurA [Natrinema pallidum]|uniref:DNA double-strand break repair nuclease NurA n=1 Tax=Natrinema pallidum TaxID=69527 RepID=UPI0037515759